MKIVNFIKKQIKRFKEIYNFIIEGVIVILFFSIIVSTSSILVNFIFNVIDFYIGTDIMNSVIAKSFIENPNMSVNLCIFEYVISSGMLGVFVGLFILSLYVGVKSILKTIVKDWRES